MRFMINTIISQLILAENKIICAISHAIKYRACAKEIG